MLQVSPQHKQEIQHWSCLLEWVLILRWNYIDHFIVKQEVFIFDQAQWTAIRHPVHGRGASAGVLSHQVLHPSLVRHQEYRSPASTGLELMESWLFTLSSWGWRLPPPVCQLMPCSKTHPGQPTKASSSHTLLFPHVMGRFQLPPHQDAVLGSNASLQLHNAKEHICL